MPDFGMSIPLPDHVGRTRVYLADSFLAGQSLTIRGTSKNALISYLTELELLVQDALKKAIAA